MTNFTKLIKNYYRPYNLLKIEEIDNEIITASNEQERKLLIKKYTSLINDLKIRFKELVLERNKLAREKGFDNFFDFIANWDKVPQDKLDKFLKDGDKTAKKILDDLPEKLKDPDWLIGNHNNFNFSGMIKNIEFNIPNDILSFLISKLKISKEIVDQIDLRKTNKFNFTTGSDLETKKVWIEYNDKRSNMDIAIGLAHEYGHAIEYVKLLASDTDPESKPYYYHEEHAIDVETEFIKSLPKEVQHAYRGGYLYTFANAFFEEEIYKNPDCDYEIAYANSRNKVCPQMKQTKNPFYVFNTFLIEYPCYSTIYSVIYNEKLKESSKFLTSPIK